MAKLYEYQSKSILAKEKILTPKGILIREPEEARYAESEFPRGAVLKAQVLSTGRGKEGGVRIALNPDEAYPMAKDLFGRVIKGNKVEEILLEERLDIASEYFIGITLSDETKGPVLLLSLEGGVEIEELAEKEPWKIKEIEIDYLNGPDEKEIERTLLEWKVSPDIVRKWLDLSKKLCHVFRTYEMTTLEINPLILTQKGDFIAGDCKATVDDYALFRHPELNMIDIPRDLGHPPTFLERAAWEVEKEDYRGTFYFAELAEVGEGHGYVGFHGGGGGGTMACLDQLTRNGLKPACYCDTSGNPPASKIYRAIKIILSIPNIEGHLWISDGVASQDLTHGARGLVKALTEMRPKIPIIIRLVGNNDEKAKEIVLKGTEGLGLRLEYYTEEKTTEFCIRRIKEMICPS